jgi:hypothetical protein
LDLEIKHAIAGRGLSSGTLGRHEEALQVFEKNLTRPTSDAALRNKEVMSDAPLSCLQILKAFFFVLSLETPTISSSPVSTTFRNRIRG